jgi:hypothetical protein
MARRSRREEENNTEDRVKSNQINQPTSLSREEKEYVSRPFLISQQTSKGGNQKPSTFISPAFHVPAMISHVCRHVCMMMHVQSPEAAQLSSVQFSSGSHSPYPTYLQRSN